MIKVVLRKQQHRWMAHHRHLKVQRSRRLEWLWVLEERLSQEIRIKEWFKSIYWRLVISKWYYHRFSLNWAKLRGKIKNSIKQAGIVVMVKMWGISVAPLEERFLWRILRSGRILAVTEMLLMNYNKNARPNSSLLLNLGNRRILPSRISSSVAG